MEQKVRETGMRTLRRILLVMAVLLAMRSMEPLYGQMATVKARRYAQVVKPVELSGGDLQRYRVYSMADAVRYFAGVQFKDYGGVAGFKTINIRSLGSERMGVFYNGIELGNGMNGQADLTKFSLDNVGSIALYSGQKADIFQSATDFASTGSLYINTQRPSFKREQKLNVRAGLKGGSYFLVNPAVTIESDLGNYIMSSVSVELLTNNANYPYHYLRKNAQGEVIFDQKGRRENNRIHATRMEGALFGVMDNGVWNVNVYNYSSQRGVPGAMINDISYHGENLTERNTIVQANVKFDVKPGYRTQLQMKFANDYLHYVNEDEKLAKMDESYWQYDGYLSNSHKYVIIEDLDLSAAYDLHFNLLRKRDEITGETPSNFSNPWRLRHLASVTLQYVIAGFQVQATGLGTYVQNFGKKELNPYGNEWAVTPALLLSYTPWRRAGFTMQAQVKQSYRTPNYNDRYVSIVESGMLRPEMMNLYSFALILDRRGDGVVRKYGVQAEGFFHDVKNKIIAYPKGQLYRWSMTNLNRVNEMGADASAYLTLRFLEELDISTKVQYRYQIAQDMSDKNDTYYKNQIPNIPWHSGSAIFNVHWRGWSLNYSFLYAGKRYSRQENIPYYEMQPWYNHDISLQKQFKVGEWNFRAMVEVNNVLGEDYEIIMNYPMPKQMYRVTFMAEL